MSYIYLTMIILPMISSLISLRVKPNTLFIWLAFILTLINFYIYQDLNSIIAILVMFISAIIHSFSIRFMFGDRNIKSYFAKLSLLTSAILLFVGSDDIRILIIGFTVSNLILTRLINHNDQWQEARESGLLAFKYLLASSFFLTSALLILSFDLGSFSLKYIIVNFKTGSNQLVYLSCILIILSVIIQSSCIPAHKWVISTMNSPTPVSAMMHAGLINCGGIVLAKLSALFFVYTSLLTIIFIIGSISALIGSMWMMVQNDVKHKLGCSTIAQMGFMLMQCGMGLFASAICHIFFHGLFKAAMFLSSGCALHEDRIEPAISANKKVYFSDILTAIFFALFGSCVFVYIAEIDLRELNSRLIQLLFVFIVVMQASVILAKSNKIINFVIVTSFSGFYGLIVSSFERFLPHNLTISQPINIVHISVILLFFLLWVMSLQSNNISLAIYKLLLNSSQPDKATCTKLRKKYIY